MCNLYNMTSAHQAMIEMGFLWEKAQRNLPPPRPLPPRHASPLRRAAKVRAWVRARLRVWLPAATVPTKLSAATVQAKLPGATFPAMLRVEQPQMPELPGMSVPAERLPVQQPLKPRPGKTQRLACRSATPPSVAITPTLTTIGVRRGMRTLPRWRRNLHWTGPRRPVPGRAAKRRTRRETVRQPAPPMVLTGSQPPRRSAPPGHPGRVPPPLRARLLPRTRRTTLGPARSSRHPACGWWEPRAISAGLRSSPLPPAKPVKAVEAPPCRPAMSRPLPRFRRPSR